MKTARAQITEAAGIFEQIMRENLSAMAEDFVAQIMSKARRLPEGQWGSIPNGLSLRGVNAYKETMLTAMAVVASDALTRARKEVPKAAKVKLAECDEAAILLGEWEKLPAKIRKRLGEQHKLLIDSQIGDVQKSIVWQFSHSHASTDSLSVLENDISAAAKDYIASSVHAASGLVGAQVVNEVRNAFFLEDEVLDQLDAFQFVNDDPVTAICENLAGQYFPKDDPNLERYTPPLHWNCKSWLRPVLKGNVPKDEKIRPLNPPASAVKGIQFSEAATCCGSCGRKSGD